jgi:NAD(P)-dependent dehydrogenase (short-subunit alcohol dehydrogenase family)
VTVPKSTRVALITGGTTGIGLATVHVLHRRGYAVLVTGANPDTLAAAKALLPDDVVVLQADARSLTHAEVVAAELKQRFGKLDVAFLNAGVTTLAPLESLDEATYDRYFDINVKGQVFMLQQVLPLLVRGSSVIFTSSTAADRAQPGMAIYAASKGAQLSLMRTLAVELSPRAIRVNAVSPGPVDTPMVTKLGLPEDVLTSFRASFTDRIPVGRFGTAEEIGNAVAFLASPEASYINGANLIVDGGITIA